MPELSPVAQEVFQVAEESSWDWPSMQQAHFSTIVAAALRATANGIIPEETLEAIPPREGGALAGVEWCVATDRQRIRSELLSIADEIENHA